jgi:hypothetical protein
MTHWYEKAVERAAVSAAGVDIHQVPGRKQECALVEAFRDGLSATGRFSEFIPSSAAT